MLFTSFGSGVDADRLIAHTLDSGKCLPRMLGPRRMAAFRVTDPAADLIPGFWGIPEPRPGLPEVAPTDLAAIIVPGSVLDARGRRYGYGGGSCDTCLPGTRRGVPRVALDLDLQIVDELSCEPHDLTVNVVVPETGAVRSD